MNLLASTFVAFILVLLPSLVIMWAIEDISNLWRKYARKADIRLARLQSQCLRALHSRRETGHVPANLEWRGIPVSVAPAEIGGVTR
jgi:hypothetical protein